MRKATDQEIQKIKDLLELQTPWTVIRAELKVSMKTLKAWADEALIPRSPHSRHHWNPTPDEIAGVIKMRAEKKTHYEIADHFDVSRDTISRVLRRYGDQPCFRLPANRRNATDNEIEIAKKMIALGESKKSICDEIKIHPITFDRWIDFYQLDPGNFNRKKFSPDEKTKLEITGLARTYTLAQLTIRFKTTRACMKRFLQENNIQAVNGNQNRTRSRSNVISITRPRPAKELPTPQPEKAPKANKFPKRTDPNDRIERSIADRFRNLGSCRAY
jgi:hypothetical protein